MISFTAEQRFIVLTRVTSESFCSWPHAETAAAPRDSAVRKRYAHFRRTDRSELFLPEVPAEGALLVHRVDHDVGLLDLLLQELVDRLHLPLHPHAAL